ncbi:hypothetical protein DAI22_01g115108 [Oryza sativa Japonica Group]|nr:hypothetical protein DAI22_01g115108 [Oryza sativa Japonica Group]
METAKHTPNILDARTQQTEGKQGRIADTIFALTTTLRNQKHHRREGNSLDHQLRPLNDRSVIKEMNGAKRSAKAVGCQNT